MRRRFDEADLVAGGGGEAVRGGEAAGGAGSGAQGEAVGEEGGDEEADGVGGVDVGFVEGPVGG